MKDYLKKDCTRLKDKKLFLFDQDGTLYNGDTLFDGAKEIILKYKIKICDIINI